MKKIDVYGLNPDEVKQLRKIAKERYGKASVSLLAKKLLQEQIKPLEICTASVHKENLHDNPRFTVSWLPNQYRYLVQKATLQHDSLSSIVRDIVQEYITKNLVLSNTEVQALYQSNYQLLRLGRNINQIARQLNSIQPSSFSTHQFNDLAQFIAQHTEAVGRVLRKQGKPFKYRPIGEHHAATEQTD